MFISSIRKTRLYNSKTGLICHLLIYAPSGRRLNYRTNGVKMIFDRGCCHDYSVATDIYACE